MMFASAIFFVTLLVRMTLAIPSQIYTIYQFLTCTMMKCDMTYVKYRDKIFKDILMWMHYLVSPLVRLLIMTCSELIYNITLAPIYFWKLCWHPKGRSIWKMLSDPEGESIHFEYTLQPDGTKIEKARYRSRPESRKQRRKRKSRCKDQDNDVEPIIGYSSDLYMHSHYQINRASINQMDGSATAENNSSIESLQQAVHLAIYFASIFHSAMDFIFPKPPKEPPKGLVTAIAMIPITWICISSQLAIACVRIMRHKSKPKKKHRRKRSAKASARRRFKKISRRHLDTFCARHLIKQNSQAQVETMTSASKGAYSTLHRIQGFTTSFADADAEKLNTQVPFDTDSIFFVCDNSTTGHICNDLLKFVPGSLQQTTRRLTTANGTGPPVQEGTIKVNLADDDGKVHMFLLEGCIYHPDSPVNLLSTRRLAEKFLDEDGNPDEDTRIESRYSTHTLTWCFGKYKKTFPTPISGLPELLFDEGYDRYKSFLVQVENPTRKSSTATIEFDDDEIDNDNMLFMENESVKFNDGNGTHDTAIYLGPISHGENLKHKIRRPDHEEYLVDREHLSSTTIPDIANVPVSIEEYQSELHNLTPSQLKDISKPSILDQDQSDLVALHNKMNHLPFPAMMKLAEKGHIEKRFLKLKHKQPICMSCIFGTSHRRPWRSKKTPGTIRKDTETEPGDCVSIDQIVSAQPGLIPQMSGYLTNMRIWGATVFVDHVSDYTHVALMRDLTLDETLLAKTSFERLANDGGVKIKAYRADNGRFADKGFHSAVQESNQSITFCAVGGHHQNGIVERKIKELTLIARTLLLHSIRHWPEYTTTMMWPFALKEAAFRLNKLSLRSDGRSNEAAFFGIDGCIIEPSMFHTFGCPCFVLDARLQSGLSSCPKWEPRSRLGIYVGHSPSHAGTVALVLNPRTGHVSPQFHIIFDDLFTTVPSMNKNQLPPNWADLVENSRESVTDERFDLAKTWLFPSADSGDNSAIPEPSPPQQQAMTVPTTATQEATQYKTINFLAENPARLPVCEGDDEQSSTNDLEAPTMINLATSGLRRSQRIKNMTSPNSDGPAIMAYTSHVKKESTFNRPKRKIPILSFFSVFCAVGMLWSFTTPTSPHVHNEACHSFTTRVSNDYERVNGLFDDTMNELCHQVQSFTTSNEAYTYKQMLQENDCKDFFDAMLEEIEVHENRAHWTLMRRDDIPPGAKTIMAIWSFKRKRYPDGSLHKHKARLCAHGGQQTWGQDYWDTYAPVVTWASVRLLLIIAKIHKLDSKSIDFVLAFPQADLPIPVYMELPAGVTPVDDIDSNKRQYVLRLNKSLYGLKSSGHNWFEKLRSGLLSRGFIQSQIDKCVFYRDGCIVLTYVDDCIIIGQSMKTVDAVINSLRDGNEDFELTDEGSLDKYIGVLIKDISSNSFEMSQPFLIRRIIASLSLDENKTRGRETPVGKPLLNRDLDGSPRKHVWLYRGAVGMLSYLANSVRPEIMMAVHQTARFSMNPMRSHELAIMRLGRYLVDNPDRGVIYTIDKSRGLEVYVDADFAGGWNMADATNADNVLSRTGFVICYAGCPIVWSSKLQTEIALSTAEAEYIAMSQALREALPIQRLAKEINCIVPLFTPTTNFCLTVHEDNLSSISMAESLKFSPRTKHIAIKYHHFRSKVKTSYNPSGDIIIKYISTKKQLADIFTKPVDDVTFFTLRRLLCGW